MDGERNLFDRFGGVRAMADAMNEAASTVQSWKTAGRISATKQPLVLEKAFELGLDVQAIDVIFPLRARPDVVCTHAAKISDAVPADQFVRPRELKRSAS